MRITCPECGFERQVPDDKVPATSVVATCPKCKNRFKFRELGARPVYGVHSEDFGPEEDSSETAEAAEIRSESARPQGARPEDAQSESRPSEAFPEETLARAPEQTPEQAPKEAPAAPGVQEPGDSPEPQAAEEPDAAEEDLAGRYSPPPSATWVPDEEGAAASAAPSPLAPSNAKDEMPPPSASVESASPDDFCGDQDDPGLEDIPEAGGFMAPGPDQPDQPEQPDPAAATTPSVRGREETRMSQAAEADGAHEPPPGREKDGVRDIWARLQAMDDESAPSSATSRKTAGHDASGADLASGEGGEGGEPPWERLESYGFFSGLVLTLKKILFQPVEFFESLVPGRGVVKSMVFYLVLLESLLLVDFLWIFIGIQANPLDPSQMRNLNLPDLTGPGFLVSLILTPILFAGALCLFSLVLHGLLTIFQCAARGVGDTLRVVFYGAAPMILYAVPVTRLIMLPVIVIWIIALQAIGLKKVQGGPYANTLAAIFIVWSVCMFAFGALLKVALPGFAL